MRTHINEQTLWMPVPDSRLQAMEETLRGWEGVREALEAMLEDARANEDTVAEYRALHALHRSEVQMRRVRDEIDRILFERSA